MSKHVSEDRRMSIDDAVKVLNEFAHNGRHDWVFRDRCVVPLGEIGGPRQDWLSLSSREAIAMAKELEREAASDVDSALDAAAKALRAVGRIHAARLVEEVAAASDEAVVLALDELLGD